MMGYRLPLLLVSSVLLSACVNTASPPSAPEQVHQLKLPQSWHQVEGAADVNSQWLKALTAVAGEQLHQLVQSALQDNPTISRQRLAVDIQLQQLERAGAVFWPALDWEISGSRRTAASGAINNSFTHKIDVSYEVDIWGKLSDSHKQANLNYLAARQTYRQQRQQLVADVVTAWFNLLAEQQLLAVSEQRVKVSQQNLQIIESGYQQGLNNALDVYLTRNELNNELSQVADKQAAVKRAQRRLAQLSGSYPDVDINVSNTLPTLADDIALGVPSSILTRQPQILASWYQLLAQNAALAFAHKQRYPSINLLGSGSLSGDEVQDWFDGDFGWSLLAGISAPLFDAGRLKANENIARLQLEQAEKSYIEGLIAAFSNVENGISQELALKTRLEAMLKAQQNATAAMNLSFEQYQSGLVSLTTVLDAQNRAFAAQSTVINLKNQLLANRVALHVALGGDFADGSVDVTAPAEQEVQ